MNEELQPLLMIPDLSKSFTAMYMSPPITSQYFFKNANENPSGPGDLSDPHIHTADRTSAKLIGASSSKLFSAGNFLNLRLVKVGLHGFDSLNFAEKCLTASSFTSTEFDV